MSAIGAISTTELAAFDFDGTLTTGDSVVPFVGQVARECQSVPTLLWRTLQSMPGLVRCALGRDRDRFREIGTRIVFAGAEHHQVVGVAERYARRLMSQRLRADQIDVLRRHVESGDMVVFVSASYREYLLSIASELGVQAVLATTLEVVNGRCTGELVAGNCRGPEKVRRLEAWIHDNQMERRDLHVTAYGDSDGDTQMLAWADTAKWVARP